MAKFCNKCGKELVDGKCPDCDKEEKVVQKAEEVPAKKEELKTEEQNFNVDEVKEKVEKLKNSPTTQKLLYYYKNVLFSPVKIAKEAREDLTRRFNWLLCLINTLIISLMNIIFMNIGISKFVKFANSVSLLTGEGSVIDKADLKLPVLKIFLISIIYQIAFNILLVILEKIIFGIICRGKEKISKYFSIQMVLFTIYTIFYVISILCAMVSLKIGYLVHVFGIILDLVVLVQMAAEKKDTKKSVLAIATPVFVVIAAAAFVFVGVLIMAFGIYQYNSSSSSLMPAGSDFTTYERSIQSQGTYNW